MGRGNEDVNANLADTFSASTAQATGQSERKVQRDAERGEKVIPEVFLSTSRAYCAETLTNHNRVAAGNPLIYSLLLSSRQGQMSSFVII